MDTQQITFHGTTLEVAMQDGTPFVALRPICDALELDWPRQQQIIKCDPVLSSTVGVLAMVAADGKSRDMLCLPLDYLNGWLFKVNANRYRGERRNLIVSYQRECYRVLAEHFLLPRTTSARIESASMNTIQRAIEDAAAKDAAKIRMEMAILARRNAITDNSEFLSLAMGVVLANPQTNAIALHEQGREETLHPATFRRALDRFAAKLDNRR